MSATVAVVVVCVVPAMVWDVIIFGITKILSALGLRHDPLDGATVRFVGCWMLAWTV